MSAPDIIERLRETADALYAAHDDYASLLMREAADEIMALRDKLDDARQTADHWQRMWSESA